VKRWLKYVAAPKVARLSERVSQFVVWRLLPRQVVYWAAIRLMAHATQGKYSTQVVPELTAMDALKRWND
jgi:hypothetical protein